MGRKVKKEVGAGLPADIAKYAKEAYINRLGSLEAQQKLAQKNLNKDLKKQEELPMQYEKQLQALNAQRVYAKNYYDQEQRKKEEKLNNINAQIAQREKDKKVREEQEIERQKQRETESNKQKANKIYTSLQDIRYLSKDQLKSLFPDLTYSIKSIESIDDELDEFNDFIIDLRNRIEKIEKY